MPSRDCSCYLVVSKRATKPLVPISRQSAARVRFSPGNMLGHGRPCAHPHAIIERHGRMERLFLSQKSWVGKPADVLGLQAAVPSSTAFRRAPSLNPRPYTLVGTPSHVSRSTLRIFLAEAAKQWRDTVAVAHPVSGWFCSTSCLSIMIGSVHATARRSPHSLSLVPTSL
jgi:hypothetical protein